MKFGVMSAAFPDLRLEEIAEWAGKNGFDMIEPACWPAGQGRDRKYGGVVHIDVDDMTPNRGADITGMLGEHGLTISALAYYPNFLHPDPTHRELVISHMKKVISAAPHLKTSVVGTFIGRTWDPAVTGRAWQKDIDMNFDLVKKIWPEMLSLAADNGVKIAIEHCPMLWADTWPGGSNLPHSPALLTRLFETITADNLGINFDPSHFVWQMIDYIRFIRDFGQKIFHVHAKDLTVDRELFYQDGILGNGFRWAIPRLPGRGDLDWRRLIAELTNTGYDYVLSIEHEDSMYEGTEDLVKRGFLLARQNLAPYVV